VHQAPIEVLCRAAYSESVDDLEHVEDSDMLAIIITRIENLAWLALKLGQHGAAAYACKLLNVIAVAPHRN
jgi:hypothetical protein